MITDARPVPDVLRARQGAPGDRAPARLPAGPGGADAPPLDDVRPGVEAAGVRLRHLPAPRPRRVRGGVPQQGQGLRQRTGVDASRRPLLPARADAHRLRGAPRPPPDHAGGVHPRPSRVLRRPDGAGDRARPCTRGTPQDGFRAYPALKQLTLDIAADIFMGGAEDHGPADMDRVNEAFIACVQAASGIVRGRIPFTRWGKAYAGRDVLEDFLRHYLPARRATRTSDIFSVLCHIEDRGRRAVQRRRRRQPHDLPDDGRPRHLDHHGLDDAAAPRPAPGVAGALPRGVAGARAAPDAGRAREPRPRSTW